MKEHQTKQEQYRVLASFACSFRSMKTWCSMTLHQFHAKMNDAVVEKVQCARREDALHPITAPLSDVALMPPSTVHVTHTGSLSPE